MNIKTIVIGSLAVSLAVGATYLKLSSDNQKAVYTPIDRSALFYDGPEEVNKYLNLLRGNPSTGVVDMADYYAARAEVMAISKKNNKAALGMQWDQMGPDNVGGRTRAVLVDRNNINTVYAGSIAGGLFVSTDGSNTWTPVNSLGDNLAVSCITQTANGRVFFGTGSDFESWKTGTGLGTPGFPGNGIYEYVPATQTVVPIATNTTVPVNTLSGDFATINQITAYGNRLYIGLSTGRGLFYADPDGNGDYPTTLAGGWINPIPTETGAVHDVVVASDGTVAVSYGNEVWISPDGTLGSFVQNNFPGSSRSSVAIAPSNPNFMYVVGTSNSGTLTNLWMSIDKGVSWDVVIPGGVPSFDPFVQLSGTGGQGGYDQCIAVDPSNPGRVMVGGIQYYEFNYNPNANPIGGNWFPSASMNGGPTFIHADKHTIEWVDANTVYVGGDGGVFKSSNGGATWLEKNLGFNVTTFFGVATAGNGFFMGGAQDNGTQLFDFGTLGLTSSPLGTFLISGGDGFSCAFSDFGGGIAFTTSQGGSVTRSVGASGGPFFDSGPGSAGDAAVGSPFNTLIEHWESFNDPLSIDSIQITFTGNDSIGPGNPLIYASLTNAEDLYYELPVMTYFNSTDTFMLPDYYQNKFVFSDGANVWMTRDASRLGASNPQWHKIANAVGTPLCFTFSPDGNHLYIGNTGGAVYRISGLSMGNTDDQLDVTSGTNLVTTKTRLNLGVPGSVTGIAIDPSNPENMLISVGNYGVNDHVYRLTNAQSSGAVVTPLGNFESIQGPASGSQGYLPPMPAYDVEIDMNDNDIALIGTDFGVWGSDNVFSAATGAQVEWYDESVNGMAHVPTFQVIQQQTKLGTGTGYASNSQMYYLGTHGRGFYTSASRVINVVSVEENQAVNDIGFVTTLNVYPNPISDNGTIDFDIAEQGKASVKVYNLNGDLVKVIDLGVKNKGNHKVRFNASELSVGSYIMSLESVSDRKIAKFIVTR
jgi:Secretion system C-terminal sorting domain